MLAVPSISAIRRSFAVQELLQHLAAIAHQRALFRAARYARYDTIGLSDALLSHKAKRASSAAIATPVR